MADSAVKCSCGFISRNKAGFAKHKAANPKHRFVCEVPTSEAPPPRNRTPKKRKTGDMPVPKQLRSQSKPPLQPVVHKYGGPRISFCPSCGCPIHHIERAWEVADSING